MRNFCFCSKIIHESRQLLNGADLDGYHSDKQSPDTTQLSPTPFLSPPGVSGSPLQVLPLAQGSYSIYCSKCCNEQSIVPFSISSPLQDSAILPAEFFTESGKLHRIWKYAQNLAENDVFGLPTT